MIRITKEQFASGGEAVKLVASALRDLALPVLILALILWPTFFKQTLFDAGFRKGSIGGMEWEALSETDEELKSARMQINDLRAQIGRNNERLKADPAGNRELLEQNREVAQAAATTVRAVTQQIAANRAVAEEAEAPVIASSGWAVVFGGDSTEPAAADEIRRAVAAQIPSPQILFREGSYRSVAIFDDESAANRYLAVARQRLREDAYVVRLGSWCPERRRRGRIEACA